MNVLLAIAGGIAAYKGPEIVRALGKEGHVVRCALTRSAKRLVAVEALAAVSGQPVAWSLWQRDGSMPHIDLARWAEVMLVAPATADVIARIALGLADDLVTTLALALDAGKPLVVAPAMNTQMWDKPVVQAHVATLRARGVRIVAPIAGELACGETGVGAMAAPEALVRAIAAR